MIKFEKSKFELCPPGEQILTLRDIVEREMPSYDNPEVKTKRAHWQFTSSITNDDDAPHQFSVFTGLRFGSANAGLTKLLQMMVPGMTEDTFDTFDPGSLIGKRFDACIAHNKDPKSGNVKANLLWIRPRKKKPEAESAAPTQAKPQPKPAEAEDEDDGDDPFGDE